MSTEVYLFLPEPASSTHLREAHPYGPSADGFHADLAVEIDPSQLENNRVVAVVAGMGKLIPDPDSPQLCTMVIIPHPDTLADLLRIAGQHVVFVYRNLETPTVPDPNTSTVPAKHWPEVPLDGHRVAIKDLNIPTLPVPKSSDQHMKLLDSELAVAVEAGQEMLMPSTNGGVAGWRRLGFEIVYVPGGLWKDPGWTRLKELIDPAVMTRRLDPMTFYARVQAATSGINLAQSHHDHPLLSLLTRRTLLEIRTAQDLPFAGLVEVQKGTDPSIVFDSKVEENRGTIALEVVTGAAAPAAISYQVWRNLYVFTELPSGARAYENLPPKVLAAPEHWAVQALFMADIDDPDNWFASNNADMPLPRCTANNSVVPIIDGVEVFRSYVGALETMTGPLHYMYLAGWIMMDDFNLIDGMPLTTMKDLISRCAVNYAAKVRVMLWKPGKGNANIAECERINDLGDLGHDAEAVLDGHTHQCLLTPFPTGSHHQKFLVVSGSQGRIAYCGGVDINRNRRDSQNHGAVAPYHDVHAKLRGPAVTDIEQVFAARWNTHPTNLPKSSTVPVPTPDLGANAGTVFVQVACTFPRLIFPEYPFAPQGSFTPMEAFRCAIKKAEKFIYIEDQYLTPYPGDSLHYSVAEDPLTLVYELREALKRIDYLIMVIPNYASLSWVATASGYEYDGQCRYRRWRFINSLLEVAADKVHVFFLGRQMPPRQKSGEVATEGDLPGSSGTETKRDEIYCHSKVWIVDDVIAKIGSANCNRRSYTHDSEMDVVMVDGAVRDGARVFARDFRMKLWGEHLGMSEMPDNALLEDHMAALDYWTNPQPENSHVRPYMHTVDLELTYSGWDNLVDPDGR